MTQSRQPAGNSQQRLVRWTFWLLLALVIGMTLSPIAYLPQQAFSLWDKAQHALAFAALAALGALAYPRRVGLLAASLLVFGGAIELAQAATGWRSGDWADWLADAVGLIAGLALATLSRCVVARSLAGRSAP
ncbi:VanZ family protein [Malikia spinosa]|uniref:VanZ family protein n=1 Tax=Malikia spinosa TaxID=86180 RepID=UPI003FA225D7